MATTITPDDVRAAGALDAEEYSDETLAFPIELAEAVVTDELEPRAGIGATRRLELTASLLAAAYAVDEQSVSSVTHGMAQLSFDTERGLSLWRKALQADPTGELARTELRSATLDVPEVK